MPILIVALFFTGLIVILRWGAIKHGLYELRLQRVIKKLGKKVLRNIVMSDGVDGLIHIEYLVLTPKFILLMYVRNFEGVIFAGDSIDLWTQVIDKGSFKFDNPLIQMDEDIMSVKALISDSEVRGYMIFTDKSEFPKGKPDRIISLSDLKKKACNKSDQVSDKLQEDWERLMRVIR